MADPGAIRYLRIAQADLAEVRRMVEISGVRDSSIGFLLQQACEKALKSWIHATGGLASFTHDLVALMDWLDESSADVSPFARIAACLYQLSLSPCKTLTESIITSTT